MTYSPQIGRNIGYVGKQFKITPSDTTDIPHLGAFIHSNADYTVQLSLVGDVGEDGTIAPALSHGLPYSLLAGCQYNMAIKRVWSTGTTGGAVLYGIY